MAKPLYALTPGFLSSDECDELVNIWQFANVGFVQTPERGNIYSPHTRVVDLSDIDPHHWVFKRAREHFNASMEKFGLTELGWMSNNFLRYREGGRFVKHTDVMKRNTQGANRQFSMTIQLSDQHTGGEFVIYKPGRDDGKVVPLTKGSAVSFRSEILHEVKPVITGVRFALVVWFMTKPTEASILIKE